MTTQQTVFQVSPYFVYRSGLVTLLGEPIVPVYLKVGRPEEPTAYAMVELDYGAGKTLRFVHQLVADKYLGDIQPNTYVEHADGDVFNNDAENLRIRIGSDPLLDFRTKKLINYVRQPYKVDSIRAVRVNELGMIFRSARDAAKFIKGDHSSVYHVLKGDRKTNKTYTFDYVEPLNEKEQEIDQPKPR